MELHGDPSEAFDPLEPFRVGDALRNGFTRTDVDDPFFDRPFRGVRALKDVTTDDAHPAAARRQQITRAAQRFVPLMSTHDFFSHTTAAVLWGIPLPQLPDADIDVSVLAPRRAHCAGGVRGHQLHPRGVVRRTHPDHGLALLRRRRRGLCSAPCCGIRMIWSPLRTRSYASIGCRARHRGSLPPPSRRPPCSGHRSRRDGGEWSR